MRRSDRAYNAPLGALGVDFGNWCVMVRPTAPGVAAEVQGCAVTRLPIDVAGSIHTVSTAGHQSFWLERVTDAAGDHLRVGGDIPMGAAQQDYRAMSDPVRGSGLLLRQMLREIGLRIDGEVVLGAAAPPPTLRVLADTEGLALNEQLGRMLRYSNNYIADVLTLDAAADMGTTPTQLSGRGAGAGELRHRARRPGRRPAAPAQRQRPDAGERCCPPTIWSASWRMSIATRRRFPAYYGGLVVPRDAPFAFLREGSDAWLDRVALKTGSMDVPHSVLGIAGYLRKRDGGWIAFAAIVNGGEARPHVPLREALQAARSDVEDLLRRY